MCRSSTTRLERVKQKRPARPASRAATPNALRVAASRAEARRVRAIAGSATSLTRDSIIEGVAAALGRAVVRATLGSAPTTKVPRKEADTEYGGERPERPRLHVVDQRLGRAVAHLGRLARQSRRGVLGGLGILVDEALGGRDCLVDRFPALALDRIDRAVDALV